MNYKQAGVDVEAGDALVSWLQETTPKNQPFADRLVSGIGGFASLFRFQFPEIKNPCLVASTDGVGTKVKLAVHFQDFSGIGQDLVGMCVNDIICCGATPLFFLDYYAVSELRLAPAKAFLQSVRGACEESQCLLVGGETAEMPGVYQPGDFDCAGFVVGVVDEHQVLGAQRVKSGDRVIGVASSGFHSNGYSLLRRVFSADLEKWRDVLMTPTRLYVKLMSEVKKNPGLHAVAHITGGGMENIPRVMPENSALRLSEWKWPDPFCEVQRRTKMSNVEMLKTLNCGVGLVLIVSESEADAIVKVCANQGLQSYDLGAICTAEGAATILYPGTNS